MVLERPTKTISECIAALSSRSLFINIFKIFMNSFNKLLNHHFMSSYASGYNNGLLLGSQGLKPLLKMVQEACNELGNLGSGKTSKRK